MGQIEHGSTEEKKKYEMILAKNGIQKEIKEVITVEPELRGEHMASACDYVTIKFSDGSKDLELFVKKFVNNPQMEVFTRTMAIFEKEAEFFNSLLPDAKEFCVKKLGNDTLMNHFPKSYYGDDSTIVLENLIQKGYFMLDKFDRQDLKQAQMVLTNLARMHGVFYSMMSQMRLEDFKAKYPFTFREAFLKANLKDMISPFFENGINTCIDIVQANHTEKGRKEIEWMVNHQGKIYDTMCNLIVIAPEESLLVINHGDCWNNNMMFRKDEDGTITEHLLLDLQITRHGSPNLDLGYFMYTSVKAEVRRKHWKSMLKFYFDALCETVSSLGSTVNITFEAFVENFKKKCLMGIMVGLTFMSTIGAMKELDMETCPTDLEEMKIHFKNIINKWVADNPDQGQKISEDIISLIQEFEEINSQ